MGERNQEMRILRAENEEFGKSIKAMSQDLFTVTLRLETIDKLTHELLAMTETDKCYQDTENNLAIVKDQLAACQLKLRVANEEKEELLKKVIN